MKNNQKLLPLSCKGYFMLVDWFHYQLLKAFPFVFTQSKRTLAWQFVFYVEVHSRALHLFYATNQNTIIVI